ncbi:hybrid sensor histidine kinase/response regulator transcription factor [Ktedonospora formicarum]|uniref:Uncharacterized protein n=1 Tax=Ktedonospora formicarum TaxID=2778364 RepID=A0A8J3MT52_9CHLR|nr:LuxR C-terminal-related transcriptional regulator [Ktedonospora formicarum]GHO44000.1 hypothetical protein KSX_21630 [Ktedonospora formicarum]
MIEEQDLRGLDRNNFENESPVSLADGLEQLYRLLLVGERRVERDELYALALEQMCALVEAEQAWLYRYQPDEGRFVLAATRGVAEGTASMLTYLPEARMLEELAEREPGETLTAIHVEDGILWLLPLSYEPGLAGVAAFLFQQQERQRPFRADIRFLLSYLARGALLLLRESETRETLQEESILRERERLERDIHDGPAQKLTLALLKLEFAQRRMQKAAQSIESPLRDKLVEDLEQVRMLLRTCIEDLRHTISSEQPVQLEQESFTSAIKMLVDEFRAHNPEIHIEISHLPTYLVQLPQEAETTVFRFVQEALSNVLKHARATQVVVESRVQGEFLQVSVRDNGVGFETESEESLAKDSGDKHLGLKAMRERIVSVDGTLEIHSGLESGTIVVAHLPLTIAALGLTEREREVVRLMSEGLTNRAIAERLLISIETVKTHVQHIMRKLQAKDRIQVVALALRYGLS